jgi:hypothetical protein
MCDLIDKRIHSKSFTGYKRVLKIRGRYFSPAMGIEYKEGMNLPELSPGDVPQKSIYKGSAFTEPDLILRSICYSELMQGRTAVYRHLEGAWDRSCTGETIIRMTISGCLLKGDYGDKKVVAGRHIDKIEPLSEKELDSLNNPTFFEPELCVKLG